MHAYITQRGTRCLLFELLSIFSHAHTHVYSAHLNIEGISNGPLLQLRANLLRLLLSNHN